MKRILLLLSAAIIVVGCQKNDPETPEPITKEPKVEMNEPAGGYAVDKMKWINIQPQVTNDGAVYKWFLDTKEIAQTKDLHYVFEKAGSYVLKFKATNGDGETSKSVTVKVADKPYLNRVTRVYDFLAAPGQFTNTMPEWVAGDDAEKMRVKAEIALTKGSMISLGGFGGYVVMGFDHTIINREGADFIVLGNAYTNWSEPGVIMVSYDANGNGLPDDEWYEIAGSEYNKTTTIKNYEITYFKPTSEPTDPEEPNYIRWTDNQSRSGYIAKNGFHDQPYYPSWKGASITFRGTLSVSNVYDQSGSGTYWVNPAYEWGYVDNWANNHEKAKIDINWAVDKTGAPIQLRGVDFVKVYTGIHDMAGWLGEISTEVSGFTDLNL